MRLSLLAVLLTFSPVDLRANDWPCFRGPNGDNIVTEKNLLLNWPVEGLTPLWSLPLRDEGDSTHAGPSVANGKLYVPCRLDAHDVLLCLDAETGKELWRQSFKAPAQGGVYGTGIRAAPTVFEDRVFTLNCDGELNCVNADTGALQWTVDVVRTFKGRIPNFGMSAAPTVMNGLLICEPGGVGASVAALDPKTGATVWQSGNDEASYATPQKVTLCGTEQVLAYLTSGLAGFDLKTGRELWHFEYREERHKNSPQPIVYGDTIYVSNNTLGFAAVQISNPADQWKAERIWSKRNERLHYSSPVLGGGYLYFQTSKRELKCMATQTGNVLWSAPKIGLEFAMVLLLDERHLLAALDDGQVVLFEISPDAVKELARFQAVGRAFVQPALSNGRLYLRDHQRLTCFDIRGVDTGTAGAAEAAVPPEAGPQTTTPLFSVNALSAAWAEFHHYYYVSWLVAAALACIGVYIAAREERLAATFVGASAGLGTILAMLLSGIWTEINFLHSSKFFLWVPMLMALAAALMILFARLYFPNIQRRLLWAQVLGLGVMLFLISKLQVSTVDVHAVLLSTDIGGSGSEVGLLMGAEAVTALVVLAGIWTLRRPGARGAFISELLIGLLLSVLIGMCVRSAGLLFCVLCLMLPSAIARLWWRSFILQAPASVALACAATTLGWMFDQNAVQTFALPAGGLMLLVLGLSKLLKSRVATP